MLRFECRKTQVEFEGRSIFLETPWENYTYSSVWWMNKTESCFFCCCFFYHNVRVAEHSKETALFTHELRDASVALIDRWESNVIYFTHGVASTLLVHGWPWHRRDMNFWSRVKVFFGVFLGPESPKKRSAGVAQMELSKPHYFAFIRSAPSKRISELGAFLVFHVGRFYTICRLSIKWRSRNKMATDIMRARRHDATSNQISSNTAKIPAHSHTLSVFLPDRFCFEFASLRGQKHETGLGEFS